MSEPNSEPIDHILKQCLTKLHRVDKFNDYLAYLHKEWLYTVGDIETISMEEGAWGNLKLPTRLKIELIMMTDPEIGEIETHETSGNNTDPEISPTEKPYTPVPNEWVLHWSSEFESYYYYNVVTMESTWDCPDEALHYEYQEQEWTEEELAEFVAAAEQATIERPGVEILTAGSHDLLCISTDENDTDVSNKTDGELNLVYKYNHSIRVHHSVEEILSHPDAVDADSDEEEDMTIVESPRPPVSGAISKPIAARPSSGNKPVKDLFFSENSAKRMSLNRLSLNANSPEKLSPRGASFRARMIAIAESASGDNSVRSPPPALRSPLPRNCSEKASSPRATAFIKTSESPRPAATIRSPRECPPAPHSTPLIAIVTTALPVAVAPVALLPTSREDEVYFESVPEHIHAEPVVVVESHTVPPPHPPSTANPHHRVFDVNAPAPQAGSVAFVVDNGTEGSHPAPPPPPPKVSHIPVHVTHLSTDSVSTAVDSAVRPQSAVQQRIANLQQKEHQNSVHHLERADQHGYHETRNK